MNTLSVIAIVLLIKTSLFFPLSAFSSSEKNETNISGLDQSTDNGKKIYESNCISCHGVSGKGNGPASKAMPKNKPRNFVTDKFKFGDSKKEILKTLKAGIPGTPMPSWKHLSDDELNSIINYILSFKKNNK